MLRGTLFLMLACALLASGYEQHYGEEVTSLMESPKQSLVEMEEGSTAQIKVGMATEGVKSLDYGEDDEEQAADPMATYMKKCAVCPAVCPAGTSCDK